MFAPHEKRFVEESTRLLQEQLAKMGVVIRKPEQLKETVLKIGKRYHELVRLEDI